MIRSRASTQWRPNGITRRAHVLLSLPESPPGCPADAPADPTRALSSKDDVRATSRSSDRCNELRVGRTQRGERVATVGTSKRVSRLAFSRCSGAGPGGRYAARAHGAHGAIALQAARRSYRWWRPPTSGIATMSPSPGGMTGRGMGVSLSSDKCVRDRSRGLTRRRAPLANCSRCARARPRANGPLSSPATADAACVAAPVVDAVRPAVRVGAQLGNAPMFGGSGGARAAPTSRSKAYPSSAATSTAATRMDFSASTTCGIASCERSPSASTPR